MWLKLPEDDDGSEILPSLSWPRMSSREGMRRTRMVVGSHHLALGANELRGRARPPDCQLALLFTTLPTFAVASGMTDMDVDVDAFVFLFFMFQLAGVGTVVVAFAGRL